MGTGRTRHGAALAGSAVVALGLGLGLGLFLAGPAAAAQLPPITVPPVVSTVLPPSDPAAPEVPALPIVPPVSLPTAPGATMPPVPEATVPTAPTIPGAPLPRPTVPDATVPSATVPQVPGPAIAGPTSTPTSPTTSTSSATTGSSTIAAPRGARPATDLPDPTAARGEAVGLPGDVAVPGETRTARSRAPGGVGESAVAAVTPRLGGYVFPMSLAALLAAFLVIQSRVDLREPKILDAPVDRTDDLLPFSGSND